MYMYDVLYLHVVCLRLPESDCAMCFNSVGLPRVRNMSM